MTTTKCVGCQTELSFEPPPMKLINEEIVSMIVIPHPNLLVCPNCGAKYQYKIVGVKQISTGFEIIEQPTNQPITPPKKQPLIMDLSSLKKKSGG